MDSVEFVEERNKCPIQTRQEKEQTIDDAGYCWAWCLWYLEVFLSNPHMDFVTLEEQAYNQITSSNINLTQYIYKDMHNFLYLKELN